MQFAVTLDAGTTVLPHAPIDVPAGTVAHWPLHLEVGGVHLDWATASPLTVLEGGPGHGRATERGAHPTLVLVAEAGIAVELATPAGVAVAAPDEADAITFPAPGVVAIDASQPRRVELSQGDARLTVLVVPAASADRVWVLDGGERRRLVLAADPVFEDTDGRISVRASAAPDVHEYDPATGRFTPVALAVEHEGASGGREPGREPGRVQAIAIGAPTPGETPPPSYGERAGRASAPSRDEVARYSSSWTLDLPADRHGRRYLEVEWAGDVARLEVGGVVVADRFWDGTPWTIGLDAIGLDALSIADATELTLRIVPLHPEASVHLPEAAAARRRRVDGPLLALDGVRLIEAPLWVEQP